MGLIGNPSAACNLPYQPTPDYLDWDKWLGPAPLRSYHKILVEADWFPNWRWYREFEEEFYRIGGSPF